jgi:hypothetical protein
MLSIRSISLALILLIGQTPRIPGPGGSGTHVSYTFVTGSTSGCWNFNANSSKCVFPLHTNPSAGNAISCNAVWTDSGSQSVTLTGSLNGSYTAVGSKKQGVNTLATSSGQMFNVLNSSAGSETITMQISSGVTPFFAVLCTMYARSSGTPSLDGTPQYSNTQASGTTGTISGLTTISNTGVLIAHCMGATNSCTAAGGFTSRNDTAATNCQNGVCSSTTTGNFNASGGGGLIEDKFNSTSGAQSATFTVGNNDDVIFGLEALQ